MKTFESVADMKAAQLRAGQLVKCKRYYAGGDLVEGLEYEVRTAETVDGFVDHELANGNVAKFVSSDEINVKQVGAVGDGVADDTTAIQAAIDFSDSGAVLIPFGDYIISERLSASNKTNFTIKLKGCTLTQTASLRRVIGFENSNNVAILGEGARLNGVGTDYNPIIRTTEAEGVRISTSSQVRIEGLAIRNMGNCGVRLFESDTVLIKNNYIEGTGASLSNILPNGNNQFGIDVYLFGNSNITVEGNTVSHVAQGIFASRGNNHKFINNTVRDVDGQHGFYINPLSNLSVIGNIVERSNNAGIKIQLNGEDVNGNVTGVVVADNITRDSGVSGIELNVLFSTGTPTFKYDSVTITGNNVYNSDGSGIYIEYAIRALISDNNVFNSGAYGIFSNVVSGSIQDNMLDRSGFNAIYTIPNGVKPIYIENNKMNDPCLSGSGATSYAINAPNPSATGARIYLRNNVITLEDSTTVTRPFSGSGSNYAEQYFENNLFTTQTGLMHINVSAVKMFRGNIVLGTQTGGVFPSGTVFGDAGKVKFASDTPPNLSETDQYYVGDIVWNSEPLSGEFIGWVCVASGSPGTWRGFGTIET